MQSVVAVVLLSVITVSPLRLARQSGAAVEGARDQAVIRAVLRDTIVGRSKEMDDGHPENTKTVLSAETLIRCGSVVRARCISKDAIDVARSAASNGKWSYALTGLLERLDTPGHLEAIESPNVSMTQKLSELRSEGPFAMAVSKPVYLDDYSLLYVQFGHGYNNRTWLTLVHNVPSKGWNVELEMLVSIGDAPIAQSNTATR